MLDYVLPGVSCINEEAQPQAGMQQRQNETENVTRLYAKGDFRLFNGNVREVSR